MKPSSIRKVVPNLFAKRRVPFIWGPVGAGKSDLVHSIAADMKCAIVDLRMALLDLTEVKGFPVIGADRKSVKWVPANFLPTKGTGILFLDEMNSASPAIQAQGYQLILNRRIGDYELPSGWHIIAAGNRAGDRSIVSAQPAALANRFIHIDYEVSHVDWQNWARDSGIHSDIRAFVEFRPNLLCDPDNAKNPRAFPSPRTWEFVNDIYQDYVSADDEFELIKGTVGEGAAGEFLAFTRQLKDLPTAEQIFKDPTGTKVPSSPAAKYAISTMLDSCTTKKTLPAAMTYMDRLPVEFQVVYVRGLLRADPKLASEAAYTSWCVKNYEVMAG